MADYTGSSRPDELEALTALDDADLLVAFDNSDADSKTKKITKANFVADLADETQTLTNKTIDQDGTGNSITNIADASIKAAAAIDATKIADGTVTNTEFQHINTLSSNAQTQLTSKISASSSDTLTNKSIDANGTGNNISNIDWVNDTITGTDGEIPTYDASGNPAMVATGTAAQVLTSNGAGTAPTFQTPAGGAGWTLQSYNTATATSITVSSLDLATDKHYRMIVKMSDGATDSREVLQSQINGVTTADSYGSVWTGRILDFSASTDSEQSGSAVGAAWKAGSASSSSHMTVDFNIMDDQATAARVSGHWNMNTVGKSADADDMAVYTGMWYQKTQTNMTSIKYYLSGAQTKEWEVWILIPATS